MRTAVAIQGLDHAERRERSEVAVEVAAGRHGVDVGTEQNRRQRRVGSGTQGEDVARRIDPRRQPGRAHQVQDVTPAGEIGVRVGDAADAVRERSAGGASEHAERFDARAQGLRVDGEGRRT